MLFAPSALTMGITNGIATASTSGHKAALIIKAPVSGDLTHVRFPTSTVTTGAILNIRIETLSGVNPSGTLWATDTEATQVVLDTDDNTWFRVALTAPATITRGDRYAIVIQFTAGTPNMVFAGSGFTDGVSRGVPYPRRFNGSVWSGAQSFSFISEYDGSYPYIPTVIPGLITVVNLGPSASPDEVGHRFKLAVPTTVEGVLYAITQQTNLTYRLYDDAGTLLQSVSQPAVSAAPIVPGFVPFDEPIDLAADAWYRLTLFSGSSYEFVYKPVVPDSALMELMPLGPNFQWCQRTDEGTWTDLATAQMLNYCPAFDAEPFVSGGFGGSSGGTRMYLG